MKKAVDKILNNFVFDGLDILDYKIEELDTVAKNIKLYKVEFYMHRDIPLDEAESVLEKVETALSMLGFQSVSVDYHYRQNKFVVKGQGYIKLK